MLMVYLLQSHFTSEKSWSNGGDSLYKGDYLSARVAFPRTHFWIVFNDERSSKLLWISPFGPFLTDKSQNCLIPLRDEAFYAEACTSSQISQAWRPGSAVAFRSLHVMPLAVSLLPFSSNKTLCFVFDRHIWTHLPRRAGGWKGSQ